MQNLNNGKVLSVFKKIALRSRAGNEWITQSLFRCNYDIPTTTQMSAHLYAKNTWTGENCHL